MAIRIAMFNHKGGVSKTTTTFNLGWMLASKGYKVVLVDADPQCNLTGLVLGYQGFDEFDAFYEKHPKQNIKFGLAPAFESQPRQVEAVECVKAKGRRNLFLVPGHINLSEYEVTLGIAQELSGTIQALQNVPGSLSFFLDKIAEKYEADFVLVDMNPSLGPINQNLLMTSDYFIVPTAPDYFSRMAISSLLSVLPRWHAWFSKAQSHPVFRTAAYPFPTTIPKLLGTVIQKYRPRKGEATEGFQKWIDEINQVVSTKLVKALAPLGMTLPIAKYKKVDSDFGKTYCLAQIPDFNTLIATSQTHRIPIFALKDSMFGHVGKVLQQDQKKRRDFRKIFDQLSNRVISLTS